MAPCHLATSRQIGRPAWHSADLPGSHPHHHRAHILLPFSYLHGQIGNIGGLCNPRHGPDTAIEIIIDTGRLGIGAQRIALYHPQVRTTVVQQSHAVIHHPPVDTGHNQCDAQQ